jgi:hypothetical protein
MVVLIRRRKGIASIRLFEQHEDAVAAAREFVGIHNPVDGCSTPAVETVKRTASGPDFSVSRSSSFGLRSAIVRPISTEFETSIM